MELPTVEPRRLQENDHQNAPVSDQASADVRPRNTEALPSDGHAGYTKSSTHPGNINIYGRSPESEHGNVSAPRPPSDFKDRTREVEEANRAKEVILAETGWSSYADYVADFIQKSSFSSSHWSHLEDGLHNSGLLEDTDQEVSCIVLEVSQRQDGPPELHLCGERLSAVETFAVIHCPREDVITRIMFWDLPYESTIQSYWLDVLGLGLQLDPQFLHHVRSQARTPPRAIGGWRDEVIGANYFSTNGLHITVANNYARNSSEPIPVIVVVGDFHELDKHVNRWVDKGIMNRWGALVGKSPQYKPAPIIQSALVWFEVYPKLLNAFLNHQEAFTNSVRDYVLVCLLPLIVLDTMPLESFARSIRIRGHATQTDQLGSRWLFPKRTDLRGLIEASDNRLQSLLLFITSQLGPNASGHRLFGHCLAERTYTLAAARSLESEIRDQLQIKVGELALIESSKSIELSNLQIQEGKRVKIFTVLAFIYVPLTLATSVFGMNIQQLNGSGRDLRVFILTTILALIITAACWWLLQDLSKWRQWSRNTEPQRKAPDHGLIVRFVLLTWLIQNGHWQWMLQSGAAWRLLINSSDGYEPDYHVGVLQHKATQDLTAVEYTSKFMSQKIEMEGMEPWDINSGRWE